ncbi:MAG: alpha/beta hydrolase [Clostridia bacterium]|nr:alpha/beta hydrolase [Clostridia bacterium]
MDNFFYSSTEKGDGKPILFLHGYLSNKESFYYQTEYLSAFARTIAVDLPGFGKTPEPPFGYSLGDYVDFVRGVIENRCGGRTDIIAHSFGGRIALKLAALYPDAVSRMLLTGSAGMKPRRTLRFYAKKGTYRILKKFFPCREKALREKFSSPDYLALSPVMRESFVKIISEHLEKYLPQIKAPTLLVFGENDRETPLYMARRLNRNIAGSGLVIMKDCGHFCFSQNPAVFNAIAFEFFN